MTQQIKKLWNDTTKPNIKEQLEEVVRKHLPEKKKENYLSPDIRIDEQNGFNQALSQINASLIADEVLKVVVEKIKSKKKFIDDELPVDMKEDMETYNLAIDCIINLF